jgi:hypothetical protein
MLHGLAALAPSLIVCAAFLIGVAALVRRELPPRRQARRAEMRPEAGDSPEGPAGAPGTHGDGSAARSEAETNPDRGDGSQT